MECRIYAIVFYLLFCLRQISATFPPLSCRVMPSYAELALFNIGQLAEGKTATDRLNKGFSGLYGTNYYYEHFSCSQKSNYLILFVSFIFQNPTGRINKGFLGFALCEIDC